MYFWCCNLKEIACVGLFHVLPSDYTFYLVDYISLGPNCTVRFFIRVSSGFKSVKVLVKVNSTTHNYKLSI